MNKHFKRDRSTDRGQRFELKREREREREREIERKQNILGWTSFDSIKRLSITRYRSTDKGQRFELKRERYKEIEKKKTKHFGLDKFR